MRVLESSLKRIPSETTDRPRTPCSDETNESGEKPSTSTEDDAQPSACTGQRTPASPFHMSSLSTHTSAHLSVRSEMWPSVSSEALIASLDEPSESSSSQSSPSPTTSTIPSTSAGSTRSADRSRPSPAAHGTSEDSVAVQRRYRYIRSRIPVRGHSFCTCLDSPNRTEGRFLECLCGEESGSGACKIVFVWHFTKKKIIYSIELYNFTMKFYGVNFRV